MIDVDRDVAGEIRETIADRLLESLAEQDDRPADQFRDAPIDPVPSSQDSATSGDGSASANDESASRSQ